MESIHIWETINKDKDDEDFDVICSDHYNRLPN